MLLCQWSSSARSNASELSHRQTSCLLPSLYLHNQPGTKVPEDLLSNNAPPYDAKKSSSSIVALL